MSASDLRIEQNGTHSRTGSVVAVVPRLALRPEEACAALGVGPDYFREHVAPELRWTRRGRVKLVAVAELERWLRDTGERTWEP